MTAWLAACVGSVRDRLRFDRLRKRGSRLWLKCRQRAHQARLAAAWYAKSATPYRPFFVVATHRSGSTLLLDYLDQLPTVQCASEVLCDVLPFGLSKRQSRPDIALRHIRRSLHVLTGQVRGCKLMLDQMQRCGLTVSLLTEAFPEARYIVLYRRSLIEQFVSLETARATDQWHLAPGEQARHARVWIDPSKLKDYCRQIRASYHALLTSEDLEGRSVVLSYEELIAQPEETLRQQICPFLEAPYPTPTARLRKQGSRPLEDRVLNYRQIAGLWADPQCWQQYALSRDQRHVRQAA
jgi:LPS sulfotransferase NodH